LIKIVNEGVEVLILLFTALGTNTCFESSALRNSEVIYSGKDSYPKDTPKKGGGQTKNIWLAHKKKYFERTV